MKIMDVLQMVDLKRKKNGCKANGRLDLQRENNKYLTNGRFDLI